MRWVDQASYVGLCRRVAKRPHLRHRRRSDCARSTPPDLAVLLAEIRLAHQQGQADLPQIRMRTEAGLDLADRLGDHEMAEAFRALLAKMPEPAPPEA